MSNAALAIMPASATKWTVVSGPMTGAVRLMNAPSFVVGRAPECDLVIVNDPKCSRKHAQVMSDGFVCEVISLNDKNLVAINGREVERGNLADGDVVTFGDTQVQYNTTTAQQLGDSQVALVPPVTNPSIRSPKPIGRPRSRGRSRSSTQTGSRNFYIILVVVGLLFYWLFSSSPAKKKAAEIRSEQQIQNDIDTANKLREAAEMSLVRKGDLSVTGRQAQENFVRGFRDYKKGQFERALMSFQACLALDPQHVLCTRYSRLAQRKFDELIQWEMVLGRKYRDQSQYMACRSSFRNVMVMVKDANSKVFQEAKANYDACDALVEGRY
jgi:pSer/pThr/pTyr-binding forkhead associated (FHA) protein